MYFTSMPESSAIAGRPVVIEALLAFKIAFSTKEAPVSSTSGILISQNVFNSTLTLFNIFWRGAIKLKAKV